MTRTEELFSIKDTLAAYIALCRRLGRNFSLAEAVDKKLLTMKQARWIFDNKAPCHWALIKDEEVNGKIPNPFLDAVCVYAQTLEK